MEILEKSKSNFIDDSSFLIEFGSSYIFSCSNKIKNLSFFNFTMEFGSSCRSLQQFKSNKTNDTSFGRLLQSPKSKYVRFNLLIE
ncbi:hypothetical protein EUGRSUZ_H02371 [Eucalyptus grandis]|uniref:Uncharacterized protein n=2 Tax=Eucalyptus grandis TaxID=71139 RepID=A0ACC3JRD3_EUCGR|nr:hypothetical protein EUGRSUZ_H02371 [Eucalyptus grandis]